MSPDDRESASGGAKIGIFVVLALGALLAYSAFEWFFCRVEPSNDRVVVVIAKTGKDLPPDRIIAQEGEKGIQLEVLKPGTRQFLNPLFYEWEEHKIADVPQGKVGIRVRKFGRVPVSPA